MNDAILNVGLELAMEFGENWLEPIQSRLAERHPELSPVELNACNDTCQAAMKFGHREVASALTRTRADQRKAFELFREAVRARYSWMSDENLSHLFSQGCYYAMK